MSNTFKLTAQAKINLRLKVEGRRADGYHLLSMINVTCDLSDKIEIAINDSSEITVVLEEGLEGRAPARPGDLCDPTKNIAAIAAREFFKRAGLKKGIVIKIEKNIPIGGGLGGGSSDAAVVLKKLVEIYGDFPFVSSLALELGADVPYLMHGGLAHVECIGEKITKISCEELRGWPCLLINPGYGVNTKQAFRDLNWGDKKVPDREIPKKVSVKDLFTLVENDFLNPRDDFSRSVIAGAKKNNLIAGLSGTGSTMFLLPKSRDMDLSEAVGSLKQLPNSKLFMTRLKTN